MNEMNVVKTSEKAKNSSKSCYGCIMFDHSTVGLNKLHKYSQFNLNGEIDSTCYIFKTCKLTVV